MAPDQTPWVTLALLLRPQGRRGELLADLLTDFPDRFNPPAKVFLGPPEFAGPESGLVPADVVSSWLPHGRNAGRIVLGFGHVHSITEAEQIAGLAVMVPATDRLDLENDSVYIADLIGCTLLDRDIPVGTVRDVQFMTSPDGKRRLAEAAPLLAVDAPSGEVLIPFAREFLVDLDLPAKRISMTLPEGLVDLNLKPPPASG